MTLTMSEINHRMAGYQQTLSKNIPGRMRFNVQLIIAQLRRQRERVLYRREMVKPNRKGKVTQAMLDAVRG